MSEPDSGGAVHDEPVVRDGDQLDASVRATKLRAKMEGLSPAERLRELEAALRHVEAEVSMCAVYQQRPDRLAHELAKERAILQRRVEIIERLTQYGGEQGAERLSQWVARREELRHQIACERNAAAIDRIRRLYASLNELGIALDKPASAVASEAASALAAQEASRDADGDSSDELSDVESEAFRE